MTLAMLAYNCGEMRASRALVELKAMTAGGALPLVKTGFSENSPLT